jgi:hypothetical protein
VVNLKVPPNLILASHITGIFDVNRNTVLNDDDFTIVAAWANSITALKLNGIIFHNNFSQATCNAYESEYINFVRIDFNPKFNPNVFRYLIYDEFLKKYASKIKHVFLTDISDVVVSKNPFTQDLFIQNPKAIFSGDEPEILDNPWMKEHGTHLRTKINNYALFEQEFQNATLLNCGIIGGNIKIMQPFVEQLAAIHRNYNHDNETAYTGDMGAFNYLVRTKYNECVMHGAPINSEFKKYTQEEIFWFKHK